VVDVLVELESDDLPGYRMIEEPAGLSAFHGDKIEDRSACVSSHRGVATPRRLPLYSMGRKPVWDGPPAFTCGCVRPMSSSGPTIARGWAPRPEGSPTPPGGRPDGRVDRRGAGCQLGLGQRFAPDAFPRSMSAIRLATPPSLPETSREIWPATAWRRPVRPKQTDLPSGAPGEADPTRGSSNPPRPRESLCVGYHRCPSRGPGMNQAGRKERFTPGRRRGRPGQGQPREREAKRRARSMPLLPEPRTREPPMRGPCPRSPSQSPSRAAPPRRRRGRR
jgi:hypothetical protein